MHLPHSTANAAIIVLTVYQHCFRTASIDVALNTILSHMLGWKMEVSKSAQHLLLECWVLPA